MEISKEKIESLKKRAQDVNNKIVAATTRKEMAQKRVKELLKELGYDAESMSNSQILDVINQLEQKESEKAASFEKEIIAAENVLNSQAE